MKEYWRSNEKRSFYPGRKTRHRISRSGGAGRAREELKLNKIDGRPRAGESYFSKRMT